MYPRKGRIAQLPDCHIGLAVHFFPSAEGMQAEGGSDFEGSMSSTSHLVWRKEIRTRLSAGRLRTAEYCGDKAALDWVHGQAKAL